MSDLVARSFVHSCTYSTNIYCAPTVCHELRPDFRPHLSPGLGAPLYAVALGREDITCKVMLEQITKGEEGYWGKTILSRDNSKCRGPEMEICPAYLKKSKMAHMAGMK